MNFPSELKYTRDHEWIKMSRNEAYIGITEFAQGELGDIVYVDVEKTGVEIAADSVFGTIEAVKTVSDLFLPLSGEIVEFNDSLESSPETVNADPYGNGWMVKVKVSNVAEFDELLSSEAYKELIGA